MLPALVLTAGLGTRLDPLTRLVAKPAVRLGSHTLIERVLLWLAAEGVTDAVLNLHYKPETVTAAVGDGAHLGLRVRYSWEPVLLGSAGGPRHALPLLDAPVFLIVNGDTLCEMPLGPILAAHRASGAEVTLAAIPNPAPDRYNGLAIDDDGRVTGVIARGRTPGWHFVGVQVANARVFDALPDDVPAETVHGIYQGLMSATNGGLCVHRETGHFVDVGTPADYRRTALALSGGVAIDPRAAVSPAAVLSRCVVWPGASVAAGARLHDCIVTNVDVPAGFTAERSVLVPASVCKPGDRARVVGAMGCFDTND